MKVEGEGAAAGASQNTKPVDSISGQSKRVVRLDAPAALKDVFSVDRLLYAWKRTVRNGLRRQPLLDLHDHLDYHRQIASIASRVSHQVIEGLYRPRPPEITTLEKSMGICRRVVMPSPEDSMVLQALVDFLEPRIKKNRPSDRAFYSRSHDFPTVEKMDGTFAYPWWKLWPEFQKRIWEFSEDCDFVVVTDVASYYDTIPLRNLRQQVAKVSNVEGPLLDFLFFVLEAFVWRPDYIPHPGVGLPQVNFDTPRLLAHAYLYPADELLMKHTGGKFVRWMDDMDFGVGSRLEGKRLLKELDQLLCSYGVRLNSGKTKILSREEAAAYFWITDNRALNLLQNLIEEGSGSEKSFTRIRIKIESSYKLFRKRIVSTGKIGNWGKVQKRYINLLGKVSSSLLESELQQLLENSADLREPIFHYLGSLGYSASRFETARRFIEEQCLDDATLFAATHLIVSWKIPHDDSNIASAVELAEALGKASKVGSFFSYVSGLWLMAKYATAKRLGYFVRYQKPSWSQNEWAARQTAAVWPRLTALDQDWLSQALIAGGHFEGTKVIAHYQSLAGKEKDRQLKSYLTPDPKYAGKAYPLSKLLLALALVSDEVTEQNLQFIAALRVLFGGDTVYQAILDSRTGLQGTGEHKTT